MSRRHSNYLVFAKILGLFETAERAWVMAFGERVLLFSFGVVINLLWVMGGWGSVVVSTTDSGTASECWRVSRNLALGFFCCNCDSLGLTRTRSGVGGLAFGLWNFSLFHLFFGFRLVDWGTYCLWSPCCDWMGFIFGFYRFSLT